MNKLKVGVFTGGKSIEKEASFNSGRTICDHLDTARYDVIPIFQCSQGNLYILPWSFLHRGKISDFEHRLAYEAQKITWSNLKNIVDIIYIAAHGRYVEDGALQGFLEVLGIPYIGSKVFASALGMNKIMQKKILGNASIAVAHGIDLTTSYIKTLENLENKNEHIEFLLNNAQLEFPVIVKPVQEGSSLGISIVYELDQIYQAIIKATTINNSFMQPVLIEEYITGLEFSCVIITDYKTGTPIPLPPTEILPEKDTSFFDYEQKYMPGKAIKFTPARCSQEALTFIQNTCLQAMKALQFTNLARIDGFLTHDNKVVITDPNSLAGMAPSSFVFRQAAEINMSHTKFINHLIESELYSSSLFKTVFNPALLEKLTNSATMNTTKKMRVAVLFGGRSHEKEISLESGRNVYYKLSPQTYEPFALFLDDKLELYHIDQTLLVRNSTKEILLGLTPAMKTSWDQLPNCTDFVFIALHGAEGENGCIQGTLEMLGLPYNGSSILTSALCIDKYKTNSFLKSEGFIVPNSLLIEQSYWHTQQKEALENIENYIGFPAIVKPHNDGCSILVCKATNTHELITAIQSIFNDTKLHALIEQCIIGTELTVGIMGNDIIQVLPPSCVVASTGILSIEEKFLPGAGENQTPAPLPKAALEFVQTTAQKVYKILNCKGYARIDCFYQNEQISPTGSERVIILEINTLPGLTPATCIFHQAAEIGMKPMNFIDQIIALGFEEHQKHITPAHYLPEKKINTHKDI